MFFTFKDSYHRNLVYFDRTDPAKGLNIGVWIAPSATIIGGVKFGSYASVWYDTVIRGDKNYIYIGNYSNIQDGCTITTDDKISLNGLGSDVIVGNYVTVGLY